MVTQPPPPACAPCPCPCPEQHGEASDARPTTAPPPPCPLLSAAFSPSCSSPCGTSRPSAARRARPALGPRWSRRRSRRRSGFAARSGAVEGLGRSGSAAHASAALFWSSACTMAAVVRGGSPSGVRLGLVLGLALGLGLGVGVGVKLGLVLGLALGLGVGVGVRLGLMLGLGLGLGVGVGCAVRGGGAPSSSSSSATASTVEMRSASGSEPLSTPTADLAAYDFCARW